MASAAQERRNEFAREQGFSSYYQYVKAQKEAQGFESYSAYRNATPGEGKQVIETAAGVLTRSIPTKEGDAGRLGTIERRAGRLDPDQVVDLTVEVDTPSGPRSVTVSVPAGVVAGDVMGTALALLGVQYRGGSWSPDDVRSVQMVER